MPRKRQTGPELYAMAPVPAMKVQAPYYAVAEWCGGKVCKDGPRFDYIFVSNGDGDSFRAIAGQYIVEYMPGIYTKLDSEKFQSVYTKVEKS